MIDWMSVDTLIDVIIKRKRPNFSFVSPVQDILYFDAQGLIAWCEIRNTGYYLKYYLHH